MALKISDMPPTSTLTGDELIELVQSGANTQSTVQAISDFVIAQQSELEQTVEQLTTTQAALSATTDKLKSVTDRNSVKTNVLTKCMFGRYNNYNIGSNPYTCNIVMELESHFTGIRVGIPNINAAEQVGIKASIATVDKNEKSANWQVSVTPTGGSGWYDLTQNGNTSITLAPRIAAERASVTMLDFAPLESVARVDSGTRPMVMIRIEYPVGTVPSTPYVTTAGWRNSDSPRVMKTSIQAVAGVTDKALFTNTTNTEGNMVVVPIVQYFSKRAGKQFLLLGDSTVEGIGSSPSGCAGTQYAILAKSTIDNPIEYYNGAIHSQAPDVYQKRLVDLYDLVRPTVTVYSPYSINGVSVGGMTGGERNRIYQYLTDTIQFLRTSRPLSTLVLLEPLPCNPAFRDTGAGDSKRRDLIDMLNQYVGPITVSGYAAAVSGAQNADGQTLYITGMTDDNVHPNRNACQNALAPVIAPYLDLV